MTTYLMLTSLTAEGLRTLKNNPGRVTEVNKEVEQMGGRVVTQYATLGDYDFVTVIEAPDEQTMAKISVELGSRGTMTSRPLTAMDAPDPTGGFEGSRRRERRGAVAAPGLLCAPGTAGIAADAEVSPEIAADDVPAIVALARERGVDLA